MASVAASSTRVFTMSREEFLARFGNPDLTGVLCGYTCEHDTLAVLTVLCHAAPARVLEIGTALGHMTANLTRWTPADARIYSIGLVGGMARAADGAPEQQGDTPPRAHWAHFANHFGTAHKAFFVMGDTMTYDFARLAPLEFVFIDGGHDLEHVLNDSRKAYDALAPGGRLVWHDFNSPVPWVRVREAVEQIGFAEEVVHVEGTEVAFLCKGVAGPAALNGDGQICAGESGALKGRLSGGQEVVSGRGDDGARPYPPPHSPFGHPLPVRRGEGRGEGLPCPPAP